MMMNGDGGPVTAIEAPLGSSFRLPRTEEELERVRHEWTASDSRYLVNGKPRFWNWLTSYVDRMRDPRAKISIRNDTRAWLGGSKDTLFKLLRAMGYSGVSAFRSRTRLISAEKASKLYDMMVRENREQTEEEQVVAGVKIGAFAATQQIERGLRENIKVIQAELERVSGTLKILKERDAERSNREKMIVINLTQRKAELEDCSNRARAYKDELNSWKERVLDEDQPPPPVPPDVPVNDPINDTQGPLPSAKVLFDSVKDSVDRIGEGTEIQIQKAAAGGKVGERRMLEALQTAIHEGGALKSNTDVVAPTDGVVENGLATALMNALLSRRNQMGEPGSEESGNDEDDWDEYTSAVGASCRWCGDTAWVQCECERASYCGEVCMSKDAPAHLDSCMATSSLASDGVRVPPSIPIGIVVSPKSSKRYGGRYTDQGSPNSYRVMVPGVRFGEELILDANEEYTFVAYTNDASNHPLYISDNPRGASHQLDGQIVPGVLRRQWSTFVVNTADLPQEGRKSYVVCDHHPYMGFALRVLSH